MAEIERKSREQESRVADPIHEEYPEYYDDDTLLSTENIPARQGYVQRWVRTSLQGKEDQANIFKKMNKGWKPRPLDTVPKGQYVMKIDFNGSQVIGIHGMILMERPIALHERQKNSIEAQNKSQIMSVKHNMMQVHDPRSGLTSPEFDLRTSTTRGRMPAVDD